MRSLLSCFALGVMIEFLLVLAVQAANSEDFDPRAPTYTTGVTVGPFHGANSWPHTGTGVGILLPTGQDPTVDDSYAGQMLDWKHLQQIRVQRALRGLFRELHFAFDSDVLGREAGPTLARMALLLKENPEVWLLLGGHTDLVGSSDYNLGLAQRRAFAVAQALMQRGVPAERLEMVSFGETQPAELIPGPSSLNRRVEATPFWNQP